MPLYERRTYQVRIGRMHEDLIFEAFIWLDHIYLLRNLVGVIPV